ncbi:MAG: sulfotransferase domain-containing protein [Novosphingobium sp.]|nr:sulfotransferase domain-containing protein [Novosphingobium sp.]
MSEADSSPPPFWIQPEIQEKITWRDGDVVISVPPKSGTTWTMNIVYQLFAGGTADFRDVYEEVPWIEFVARPDQTDREVLDRLDAMPTDRRRAFKTHSAPPVVPFIPAGEGPDVKYVVVFRNPEEALVSFWPFLSKHADQWYELWGMPPGAMSRPDFPSFYRDVIVSRGMHELGFFGFLNAWWLLRHESNVLFLHYAAMKQDHEGSIRKIAKFIGLEPSEDEWQRILEYTSFGWMKAHEEKFEAATAGDVPILQRGAMIRKGQAGDATADGMTPQISRELRALGETVCPDPAMLDWFYKGTPAP